MKLIKIVNAYMAMCVLSKEKLKFKDALDLTIAKNKLKESYDFFAKAERDIVSEVAKKDEFGKLIRHPDGHFDFKDDASKEVYLRKMEELSTVDVDDISYIAIAIEPPATITAELLEALDGFVIFKEASDEGAS